MGGWGLCKKDLNEISPSGEPRTASKKGEKIKEGGVKNKITINPNVQVEEIKMSRKEYKKIHKDFKSDDPKNPRTCLLYTSPSPRDLSTSRMPSSA